MSNITKHTPINVLALLKRFSVVTYLMFNYHQSYKIAHKNNIKVIFGKTTQSKQNGKTTKHNNVMRMI